MSRTPRTGLLLIGFVGICFATSTAPSLAQQTTRPARAAATRPAAARAGPSSQPTTEPTADTPQGALKLFLRRMNDGDVERTLAACDLPGDADREAIRAAVDCYGAYADLRKAITEKWGASPPGATRLADGQFYLYGPRLPPEPELTSAKVEIDGNAAVIHLPRGPNTDVPLTRGADGQWRLTSADFLARYVGIAGSPRDAYPAFTAYAAEALDELTAGKFADYKALQDFLAQKRNDYYQHVRGQRRGGV